MEVESVTERRDALNDGASSPEMETFIEKKGRPIDDGLGSRVKFWRRKRYIIVLMTCLGELTKALLRSNLSIAVFPMTENYTTTSENGTITYVQDFDWDVKTRGFLLSVFFYGYIATNIPGGILAIKYGGGRLYGVGIILTSITTLITPVAARIHFYLLIAIRIFEGMCEGVLVAALELLLSSWIPVQERSSCVAVIVNGSMWGHIVSIVASSAIGYHWGWEAIFYCTGGFGMVWFVAWIILAKEDPELDKRILISELTYIQQYSARNQLLKNKVKHIPYIRILTSRPVWAFIIAHVASGWCYSLSITQSPAYIKDIMNLNYHKSGYLSTLPFVINVFANYLMAPIADILTTRNVLTFTMARKIYISGSLVIMAVFSFLIQQATSLTTVVICLTVMLIFTIFAHVQVEVNIIDIAPRYSSVLAGLMTTSFSLCGIFTPTLTGFLTQNKTAEEWHTVFSIQAGICLLGALVYSVFASAQIQPWAVDSSYTSPLEQDAKINTE